MQTKLEKLSLEKFASHIIPRIESIFGGVRCGLLADNGGCECDTGGGSANWGSWNSDTAVYDRNGGLTGHDYHGSAQQSPSPGGGGGVYM